nr:PREDICTED: uncharacterized protein LOC109032116 [Bemisia tabaci]
MILKRLSLCAIQILVLSNFSYCAPRSGSYSICSGSRCGRKKITRTSMVEVEDLYHLQHNDPCLQTKEGSARDQQANNLCKKLVETYLASPMYKRDWSSCKDAEFFGCERDDAEAYETHRCTVQFKTTGMWPLSNIGSHKKLLLCVEKDAEWYAKTQQEYGASYGLTEVPRGKPSIIRDQSFVSGRSGRGRSMELEPSSSRKKNRPKSSSEDFLHLWCQPLPARSTAINANNEIFYSGSASFELWGRPTD